MLHTGYIDDVTIRFAHFGNGTNLDYTIPGYSAPIPRMHSFRFSKTEGKSYWINGGGNTPDSADPAQTTALISFIGSAIGRYNTIYYTGDIGEIIIFSRDLKNEERQAIETYLSKKYGIAIS
jgi:hypothetical protein